MEIYFNRDSVCAGDDCDPHVTYFRFNRNAVCEDIMPLILQEDYLPDIYGNDVVWVLLNSNKEEIISYFTLEDLVIIHKSNVKIRDIYADDKPLFFRYYTYPNMRGGHIFLIAKGDKDNMLSQGLFEEYQHCNVTPELEEQWSKDLKKGCLDRSDFYW